MAYNKKTWANGDLITKESMNNIENGIYTAHDEIETLKNNTSTGGSNNASDITITDTGNYFTSTNVEGALQEAGSQIKDITNKVDSGNIGNNVEPELMDMPKVFFNGGKPTTKDSVYATIEYVSSNEHFKGYVDIKCQGNSSMAYPKKNYTIKMYTDETRTTKLKKDFKGWGKQNKFCLKANYIDHSHARNIVSAKLWNEIVASRSNYQELPELLRTSPMNGAIDGFPIKVYYNNTYEGVYTWNIPKDGWMNNMDDKLDTHCILCSEEYVSGCFRSANASLWSDELHDVMPASIVTSFNNFQNFVINSSDDEFKTGLSTYADVNSLIDYYIFQYVICGLDSMGKNQLFFTYDGIKWIASSYDMDSTFGLYWNGQSFVSAEYRMQEDYESGKNTSSNYNGEGNLLYVRLEQIFLNEIKARYAELRAGVLSYSNIVNEFEKFMDTIGKDLYAEDLTIYTGIPSGNTNNIQQIRNYTRDRLTYVDTQIEALRELIPCTGIVLGADTLSFTTTDAQTLSVVVSPENCTDTVTWSVSPTGIVTVKNGVVTPIGNGEATITATCGNYSDTCAVTVSGIEEGGGGTKPEIDLQTIAKVDGYYNDTGVLTQWGNLKTTDYIKMPSTSGRIKHADENATLGVIRVSYFDENKTYLGYNRGSGYGVASPGTGLIELDMDKGAKYFVVSSEDFSVLTYEYEDDGGSTGGEGTPTENILQTIAKVDGYYNDTGVLTQWGNLKTTDYIKMPSTSGRIKHTDETAQLGVTRVSYFDENKTYLGYNRGMGYGVASPGTGLIELDMDKGAKYFVVSSEDFSVLTYEYEGDGISGGDIFA